MKFEPRVLLQVMRQTHADDADDLIPYSERIVVYDVVISTDWLKNVQQVCRLFVELEYLQCNFLLLLY